ncbi:hypothetical protein ABDK56_00385 [Sphingomonas sp. ASV193]|uniref:hypothetical protein n=1 Tax=Sphingomonas sp. ASV193 TaxID=3144405 RepID=UPI0032E89C16
MIDAENPGEIAERARRSRTWRALMTVAAIAMPVGLIAGAMTGYSVGRGAGLAEATGALPPTLFIAAAILYPLAIVIGTWRFVKTIDEVELADNLWASAAGFYFYSVAFPCWWALSMAGVAAAPGGWILYIASLIAGTAVYALRKLRN